MAVYKRSYKRYDGGLTSERWRFLILPRFSFQGAFESRAFHTFYNLCFIPPILGLLVIYIHANLASLRAMNIDLGGIISVDTRFFETLLEIQSFLTFVLAAFLGPGLVSPDLTNNALPLYLSRPFTRQEYVMGKLSVIGILASFITWIPGLILFLIQANMETGWVSAHVRVAAAIFIGSIVWILVVSLLSLAMSAWVKWKPIAAAAMFGVFFVAAAFGELTSDILDLSTRWGNLLDITSVMNMIWTFLFEGLTVYETLPVWSGFMAVAAICGLSLFMLWKKVRACEVVGS